MFDLAFDQSFATSEVWEPLYRRKTVASPLEQELFRSRPVRRLKYLRHYGAGAFISSVVHSRLEHTIGVWTLACLFFSHNQELRVAAILHDIGHLPFSHAMERTFQLNHHVFTEEMIGSGEISAILTHHGIRPQTIIDLLQSDSPLSSRSRFLGLDHLDSFLRDTYLSGALLRSPSELIDRIRFNGDFVECDRQVGLHIVDAIVSDHQTFMNPRLVAYDALLSKAVQISIGVSEITINVVRQETDEGVISLLQRSQQPEVRQIVHCLLWEPDRIVISSIEGDRKLRLVVLQTYKREPLVDGRPITTVIDAAALRLKEIDELSGTFYVHIEREIPRRNGPSGA